MLLTVVPVTVALLLMHRHTHYVILAYVIKMLMCFDDRSRVFVRHEV